MMRQFKSTHKTNRSMKLKDALSSLYRHLPPHRRRQLFGVFGLSVIGAIAELGTISAIIPFLALMADPSLATRYTLLESVLGFMGWSSEKNIFSAATVLFVVMALTTGMVRVILTWVVYHFTFGVGTDLGKEVYHRILTQPYSYHVARNSSQTLASLNNVQSIVGGVINPLMQGAVSGLFVLAIAAALLFTNALASIVTASTFVAIYWLVTVLTRKKLNKNSEIIAKMEAQRIQAIQEGLGGIRDVILDGTQDLFVQRYWDCETRERRAMAVNAFMSYAPRYLIESFGMIVMASLAFVLSARIGVSGALPVLGALALGAQRALPQVQAIYYGWASINATGAVLAEIVSLLDLPASEQHPVRASDRLRFIESIELDNVCFRYIAEGPAVLSDVSLKIERGARVGFIGKTGSGKSTLVDVVMGLLQPTRGKIMIDGRVLTESNCKRWQAAIAHVPQSIYLSDATIAENIAFGLKAELIDRDRVQEAANRAKIAEFVETLPGKYDTFVGERGIRLSGGQRQRIGLARAFYKRADIIVLDEATSALDNETEAAVMNAIYSDTRDVTVLIIAHRLTTLRECDRIFALTDGRIVAELDYGDLIETAPASNS